MGKKLQLIFQPLQGFFNFCIFFSSKVFQQWNRDHNQSTVSAMKKVFGKEYDDPVFISRLSIVRNAQNRREAREVIYLSFDDIDEEEELVDPIVEDGISYPSAQTPSSGAFSNPSGNISGFSAGGSAVKKGSISENLSYPSIEERPVQQNESGSSSSSVLSPFSWFSRSTKISHLEDGNHSEYGTKENESTNVNESNVDENSVDESEENRDQIADMRAFKERSRNPRTLLRKGGGSYAHPITPQMNNDNSTRKEIRFDDRRIMFNGDEGGEGDEEDHENLGSDYGM